MPWQVIANAMLIAQSLKDAVSDAVAEKVPGLYVGLAANLAIVAAFLAFLALAMRFVKSFLTDLGQSCHDHQEKESDANREAIKQSSIVIKQCTIVLGGVMEHLRRTEGASTHTDDSDFSSGWLNKTDKAYTWTSPDGDEFVIEPGKAIIPSGHEYKIVTLPQWREWKAGGRKQ